MFLWRPFSLVCFRQTRKKGSVLNKFFSNVLNTPLSEVDYVRWLLLLPKNPSSFPLAVSALEIKQHNRNPVLLLHTFNSLSTEHLGTCLLYSFPSHLHFFPLKSDVNLCKAQTEVVLFTAELLAKGCVKAKHFHGSRKTEQCHGKVSSTSHVLVNSIKSPPPLKVNLFKYHKAFCDP